MKRKPEDTEIEPTCILTPPPLKRQHGSNRLNLFSEQKTKYNTRKYKKIKTGIIEPPPLERQYGYSRLDLLLV